MGGSKKKTKTTHYEPPSWITGASQKAIGLGQKIADQPYTPYTGERVAQLSANEQTGIDLAGSSAGSWRPYIDKSTAALERYSQPFTSADIQSYMNPYIKGALDPAAREVRQQGALRQNELRSTEAQRNAFGGSRGALLESEATRGTEQTLSDLYGQGYAGAFESGANRWQADRDANLRESQQWASVAKDFQDSKNADINALMATGGTSRAIQQAMKDFDYGQFREGRDWDVRNLTGLLAAIQGVQGSYPTDTKETTKTSGGGWSQAIGLVATLAAAYFTGGLSLGVQGGTTGALATTGSIASDRRLKTNILRIGTHPLGIGLYSWNYIWGTPAIGVMADEAELVMPEAVSRVFGYQMVNYAMLNGQSHDAVPAMAGIGA